MAKKQKKRNKQYQGVDAKALKPTVTRVQAVNRSRAGQWWFDNKRVVKPVLIAGLVVIVLIALVYQLIRIASGL